MSISGVRNNRQFVRMRGSFSGTIGVDRPWIKSLLGLRRVWPFSYRDFVLYLNAMDGHQNQRGSIRRFTSFEAMKADEYAYWQSRPVHERLAAVTELSIEG